MLQIWTYIMSYTKQNPIILKPGSQPNAKTITSGLAEFEYASKETKTI